MEQAIWTRGLAKTYKGGLEALKPIDLEIPTGVCFGLLGPNGAGKSTLVKSLLRIVRATAGEARLLGRDYRKPEARRDVGYLPEGHRFPRYLTGGGVCHYFGRLAGMHGEELKRETREKLALVGMAEWEKVKISKYSKGMNQRVGLAQAMLGDPKLVFLDEPTDGVDPQGRRELRDVIREIAGRGTTVFLNSHLLSEVEQMCDSIAILNKGTLVTSGSVGEVKNIVSGRRTNLRVRFRTGAVGAATWAMLTERGATGDAAGSFALGLAGEAEVTPLIDTLRGAGVEIYAVQPEEVNLEDAFIELISDQAGGAAS